jgi:hypothetical protein
VLAIILTLFFIIFYRAIVSVSFDTEFAKTRQVPTKFIEYSMMLFIAVHHCAQHPFGRHRSAHVAYHRSTNDRQPFYRELL